MPEDQYGNFLELSQDEVRGMDYDIRLLHRNSSTAIIAPHGGYIEPGTSEIAITIALDSFNLYCFEGLKKKGNKSLHITSTNFDEPKCLNLIARCEIVLSVHGMKGSDRAVEVGGLNVALRDRICDGLNAAGFQSKVVSTGKHAAVSQRNICNKGRKQAGVQLEITSGLRDALRSGQGNLEALALSVQQAISSQQ